MYQLTRISAVPASPLKIQVARPSGEDAGLTVGGSWVLEPGDVIQVDAFVAGVIMGDPGMAPHFECIPPWKPAETPAPAAEEAAAVEPPTAPEPIRRGGRKAGAAW